ncbi:methylaspartate mutase [Micromonospora sp. RP3T]|uniref:methylaspartate mutase n=1 Tax=Micromonospora sp. RP3T TaxID=2135446 RepID=UPI003D719AC0
MTAHPSATRAPDFGPHVRAVARTGRTVVQPRMGFTDPARMRAGLRAVLACRAATVGTITLDSYTRVGDLAAAAAAVGDGTELNGYPLLTHPVPVTRAVLADVAGMPVQVRHGCATPEAIVAGVVAAGLSATEGGPVSYCLPYGRTPLTESVEAWRRSCARLARLRDDGVRPHLETFGGCLLGQLCPPSLLVAMSVLEALFFCQHGVDSVSVSYAQQVDHAQDVAAVRALRRLAHELLPTEDQHVVVYAYMGVFPTTRHGARRVLADAARLAAAARAERLIVKTEAEAFRIPTIAENIAALEAAADEAVGPGDPVVDVDEEHRIHREAATIVAAVRDLADDVGTALLRAFRRGYLDIPYCLHPDNAGGTRGYVDDRGRLAWDRIGRLPLGGLVRPRQGRRPTAASLLGDLNRVRDRADGPDGAGLPPARPGDALGE